jgi:hypothetical protein
VTHGHHRQYKPVSERSRRGFIGLQGDRGEGVEFRHLLIKELQLSEKEGPVLPGPSQLSVQLWTEQY